MKHVALWAKWIETAPLFHCPLDYLGFLLLLALACVLGGIGDAAYSHWKRCRCRRADSLQRNRSRAESGYTRLRRGGRIVTGGLIVWQGLFVGAEQTRDWRSPLLPGLSASATAVCSVGRVGLRVVYIQPLRTVPKLGPMVQVGASVRLF